MKIKILLFVLFAGCASLHAAAPHPTVLTVKYKDQMLPVVKVIGTDPVVQVDGKEKRIRTDPVYLPQRAETFSDNRVELRDASLGGVQFARSETESVNDYNQPIMGNAGGTAEFKATLWSEKPIHGGYIAIVFYTPLMTYLKDMKELKEFRIGAPQVVVHALPDLPAATEVKVSITSMMFTVLPGQRYFAQVFDEGGLEIPTNQKWLAWKYYAIVEQDALKTAVAAYLQKFAGANRGVTPVLMARPFIPKDVPKPTEPSAATLTVGADGLVTDVTTEGISDPRLEKYVTDAMRGWLFLPKLKNGEPTAARVKIPIQF